LDFSAKIETTVGFVQGILFSYSTDVLLDVGEDILPLPLPPLPPGGGGTGIGREEVGAGARAMEARTHKTYITT